MTSRNLLWKCTKGTWKTRGIRLRAIISPLYTKIWIPLTRSTSKQINATETDNSSCLLLVVNIIWRICSSHLTLQIQWLSQRPRGTLHRISASQGVALSAQRNVLIWMRIWADTWPQLMANVTLLPGYSRGKYLLTSITPVHIKIWWLNHLKMPIITDSPSIKITSFMGRALLSVWVLSHFHLRNN